MEINRFADLRPRTVWDILDDAFDLYRERFALLAGVSAVAYVPTLLMTLALTVGPFVHMVRASQRSGAGSSDAAAAAFFELLGAFGIAVILLVIAQSMQAGATCVVVEDRLSGVQATILSAWRRMVQRLGVLVWTALLSGLVIVAVGMVTVGIGEVLYAPSVLFLPQTILLEKLGAAGGFRRASSLSNASYGRTLGLLVLSRALGFIIFGGLLGILLLIAHFLPDSGRSSPDDAGAGAALLMTLIGIAILLIAPLQGIAATLLYYDVRVRREGIDIEAAAVDHDFPLAPDYFGGVATNPSPKGAALRGRRKR